MKRSLLLLPFLCVGSMSLAFGEITLGTAETFAVLAASTVTNTGATDIKGNLGVSPGLAVVGFPPGILLKGAIHSGDAIATQAQADLTTAYNAMALVPCKFNLTGQDLGGQTLTPGVYCFDTTAQLTGTLVLDFQGSTTAGFLFKIGSSLTTASSSKVSFVNCTHHCSINWQVGSSATLGTSTKFSGNILALASITLTTDVYLCGRALAQTGAVTMDTDKVYFMGYLHPPGAEVTGDGQITVSQQASGTLAATGQAKFSFTKDPSTEETILDYFNQVTGLRVHGSVSSTEVLTTLPDGSPKTVRFSGACQNVLPQCSFSGLAEKTDVEGGSDRFGISVVGVLNEQTTPRDVTYGRAGQPLTF